MKNLLAFLALITIFLFACQNKPAVTTEEKQESVATNEDAHAGHVTKISLNNGEKWPANPETTQGISNMVIYVNEVPAEPNPNNCQALRTKMESELNSLVQQCTMTGEAHEQLHNYLIPMTEMIKRLDTQDPGDCKSTVMELKQHLHEYGNYFM